LTELKKPVGATAIGCVAILLWATLALLTTQAKGLPPFQLLAMCFAIASVASVLFQIHKLPKVLASFRQPPLAWLLSVAGLFGYHFFFFVALANAPPVQAVLVANLWPLLIVLFSALLPGERLRWFHIVGAFVGMAGAILAISGGSGTILQPEYLLGYGAALLCALIWSSYSVANRRFKQVPTSAVGGFCFVVAILGGISHLVFEETVIPQTTQWLAVLGLGLGPVGLAFFAWDYGTKHGSIQLLGVFSYAVPLLSALLLLAAGQGEWHLSILFACILVIAGALLASLDQFNKKVR